MHKLKNTMKKPKTNKRQFKIFEEEAKRLIKLWHMNGWEFTILHQINHDDDGAMSGCDANIIQRTIYLRFYVNPGCNSSDQEIKIAARHEMTHAIMHPLLNFSQDRYVTEDEIFSACHEITHRLMGLLPK